MIKLGKPSAGWIKIELIDEKNNSHKYFASYLTDVPNDLLIAAINMLKNGSFIFEFDAEDKGCYAIINGCLLESLMVIQPYEENVISEHISPTELAEYICKYIEENKEKCYDWLSYHDTEEEKTAYKNELDKNLKKLKSLMNKKSVF